MDDDDVHEHDDSDLFEHVSQVFIQVLCILCSIIHGLGVLSNDPKVLIDMESNENESNDS